jgi:C-terminal processing protease CtpA/Prc
MPSRLISLLLLSSVTVAQAVAEDSVPVQMAPVTVRAGPLGFIGVRLSASTGFIGLVSGSARLTDLVIIEVLKDSAAERAGLSAQDQILRIDGVPITSFTVNALREMGGKEKGDIIELVVQSPGTKGPRMVPVKLGARKIPPP